MGIWGAGDLGGRLRRWLKPAVTLALYGLVFYWTDAGTVLGRLRGAALGPVAAGIALYVAGQALSAYRWRILLRPVSLTTSYGRLLGFYFVGMFFNLFLPTIVGGDAVKALLLSRDTGEPARATMSVFMERNTGLCALLLLALAAAMVAPGVVVGRITLRTLVWLLATAYAVANAVLLSPAAYRLVDRAVSATPIARARPRAATLYAALVPYRQAVPALVAALGLSLVFQALVVAVVFLNAAALSLTVPLSAVAVFVPLVSLAGMVPVSVNGLGVREALYILLFGKLGVPADLAVSLALLYLAVTLVASLPGGLVYALQPTPLGLASAGNATPDLH